MNRWPGAGSSRAAAARTREASVSAARGTPLARRGGPPPRPARRGSRPWRGGRPSASAGGGGAAAAAFRLRPSEGLAERDVDGDPAVPLTWAQRGADVDPDRAETRVIANADPGAEAEARDVGE